MKSLLEIFFWKERVQMWTESWLNVGLLFWNINPIYYEKSMTLGSIGPNIHRRCICRLDWARPISSGSNKIRARIIEIVETPSHFPVFSSFHPDCRSNGCCKTGRDMFSHVLHCFLDISDFSLHCLRQWTCFGYALFLNYVLMNLEI